MSSRKDDACGRCEGFGWVCEEHEGEPADHVLPDTDLTCGGDGAPCPDCNARGERRSDLNEVIAGVRVRSDGGRRRKRPRPTIH